MCIALGLYKKVVCVCFFFRSLAVGTKNGYKLFSLSNIDKLENIYDSGKFAFLWGLYVISC